MRRHLDVLRVIENEASSGNDASAGSRWLIGGLSLFFSSFFLVPLLRSRKIGEKISPG